jgi:hypothetical protein
MDDLSYDELQLDQTPPAPSPLWTGLVVLLIAVLGAPQVWDVLRERDFDPALVYYPVLVGALGAVALRRSR